MGCDSSDAGTAMAPGGAPGGKLQVYYFAGFYGRVDPIRQMLNHAGADWEDIGVSQDDWPAMKVSGAAGEFGAMPFAKKDNMKIDLSLPVLRALGTR